MTQKSFCKENNPSQNILWPGLLVLKVGFGVTLILFCYETFFLRYLLFQTLDDII